MTQWKFQYMQKEVYILSRPSTDHSIVTQYTPREEDQDLPQLLSTSEAQEKFTLEDQASMLRCSDIRETRHTYSQLTESEKAKFQTPFTSNEAKNYVEHNSVKKISQDLVHPTDTASPSLTSEPEEREEIAETADTPAPALEKAEEQPLRRKSVSSKTRDTRRGKRTYSLGKLICHCRKGHWQSPFTKPHSQEETKDMFGS